MDERKVAAPAENTCERLGQLAATAVPADERPPDARAWARIEAKIGRSGWRSPWRLCPAVALASVALVWASAWVMARRPLGYRVESCTRTTEGALLSAGAGRVVFSDGSRVELAAGARLWVKPLPRGADLSLDDGVARLAIVHRPGARWAVQAGPFHVDVTGTRFSVEWSRQQGTLRLAVEEGEVRASGGPLPHTEILHAGQVWQAGLDGAAPEPQVEEPGPAVPAPAARAVGTRVATNSPPPATTRPQPAPSPARRRGEIALDSPSSSQATLPGGPEPPAPPPPVMPEAWPPSLPAPAPPSPPAPAVPARPLPGRISIAADGSLGGGMTGFAWLASGEGTTLSQPTLRDSSGRLRPGAGELCASGTVAGLRCVNEGLPSVRCNWDRSWGVAIGLNVRADGKAWGTEAAGAIAVEFHGRTSSYRLNAHRSGDPREKLYCIEGYKSGQIAKPGMFRSECWADKGESLADFRDVDLFNLQFSSGMEYVAFRYCIAGVQVYP